MLITLSDSFYIQLFCSLRSKRSEMFHSPLVQVLLLDHPYDKITSHRYGLLTDILSHSHAPNIVLSLPDDSYLHMHELVGLRKFPSSAIYNRVLLIQPFPHKH
ncbi:hypothetical protein Tco_0377078 [Tanacetum coccineum]